MSNTQQNWLLLVEDEPGNILLIKRAMSKLKRNIQIQAVEDGEQAVNYLKKTREDACINQYPIPSVILTDIKMPRMNGMELLAWIKQQPEFVNLPVIMLSSSGEIEDINRATELGASTYLVRPGSFTELVEIMQQVASYFNSDSVSS
ncbi:response regulator [Nostoc sp. FACHB-152]|uniref:response regulator n=1 Tax=unclassified Nostoc TaxID=2593658 RepID=UPI001683487B|nr:MULTISPECIES: response regulator [unclassified Nostoc]MBD2448679.1 response regulator [Nostoc sp. FACHB-152]MBD2468336.1 response regulator [Nostoc sp. FACHB-145]